MPSPFPGMDPYLEDPDLWRDVHHRLVTYIADDLNAAFPAGFIARVEVRAVVVEPQRDLYPDVHVLKRRRPRPRGARPRGGTTVLEPNAVGDPPLILPVTPIEIEEGFIEIRALGRDRQLVTVIEVLSPTNKTTGGAAHDQYVRKQRSILRSQVNLLEIDLLRRGSHTVGAPLTLLEPLADWDYLVSLKRGGRDECEVWPVLLPDRLPRVRVPLGSGDPDEELDLQKVLDHCYDTGRYAEEIDYRENPTVRLPPKDTAWVDELLREKGLRPSRPRRKGGRS